MEGSSVPLLISSGAHIDDNSAVHPVLAILECYICMEAPTDPVATSCGHVFCWPCLGQWLGNAPKPCPICRKVVSTHLNVLSLHPGAGDAAARSSHSNDNASEVAARAGNSTAVIPPRPANPLLFVPRELGSTPESECSMAVHGALGELVRERSRGCGLVMERARMRHRMRQLKNELLLRMADVMHEANRLGGDIAQLQRRLALANQQLSDGVESVIDGA